MPLFGNDEYAATISINETSLAPRADGRLGAMGFVMPNLRTICKGWGQTCNS